MSNTTVHTDVAQIPGQQVNTPAAEKPAATAEQPTAQQPAQEPKPATPAQPTPENPPAAPGKVAEPAAPTAPEKGLIARAKENWDLILAGVVVGGTVVYAGTKLLAKDSAASVVI